MKKEQYMKAKRITGPGYHIADIAKGVLGESSKIMEEVEELIDAERQGSRVMALVELSDLVGAIEAYLKCKKLGATFEDLRIMARITRRAFKHGHR